MKDIPPKLAEKIPKGKRRADHDDDTSEDHDEDHEIAERDQVESDGVARMVQPRSSTQREVLLLEKIARLTFLLEEAKMGGGRTGRTRYPRTGALTQIESSHRAPLRPSQDVQSV